MVGRKEIDRGDDKKDLAYAKERKALSIVGCGRSVAVKSSQNISEGERK